jgi:hypothetical protein
MKGVPVSRDVLSSIGNGIWGWFGMKHSCSTPVALFPQVSFSASARSQTSRRAPLLVVGSKKELFECPHQLSARAARDSQTIFSGAGKQMAFEGKQHAEGAVPATSLRKWDRQEHSQECQEGHPRQTGIPELFSVGALSCASRLMNLICPASSNLANRANILSLRPWRSCSTRWFASSGSDSSTK